MYTPFFINSDIPSQIHYPGPFWTAGYTRYASLLDMNLEKGVSETEKGSEEGRRRQTEGTQKGTETPKLAVRKVDSPHLCTKPEAKCWMTSPFW